MPSEEPEFYISLCEPSQIVMISYTFQLLWHGNETKVGGGPSSLRRKESFLHQDLQVTVNDSK